MAESQSLGYVALQVVPSFQGISQSLQQGLVGPTVQAGRQAGQQAGRALANSLEGARAEVAAASAKLAKAREAEVDAAGKVEIAELKLQELRDKGTASASQIRAAEERVRIARRASEQATDRARSSLQDLTEARAREANAARDGEQATDDYADSVESATGSLVDHIKQLGAAAIAFAGIGSAAELAFGQIQNEATFAKMNASLGMTGEVAKQFAADASDIYRQGWGESMEDVAGAVEAVASTFITAGFEGERSVDQITESAMAFSQVFEQDVAESVNAANQLISAGLAQDSEEAFDLMTAAFQRVPKAMRDEIPELMNEYGTFFSSLGFSGQEAMGMLVAASDDGKIAMDKVGDALKEVGIRASDIGDKGAMDALEAMGLKSTDIANGMLAGGEQGRAAFQQMIDALNLVEDPATQASHAIALFGTPLEDLNKAEIPGFLEALGSAGETMQAFEGSSAALTDQIEQTTAQSLESFTRSLKGGVTDALGTAAKFVMDNIEGFKTFGMVIAPVIGMITTYAVVTKTMAVAQAAWTAVTKAGSVAQWALNAAMAANPIGLIVAAVVGLGAALVIAYQKSETFRNIVQGAWQGIQDAASFAWNGIIKPAVDGLMAGFQWVGDKAMWLWNAAIVPAWNGISGAISTVWNGFVQPMLGNFQIMLGLVGDAALWFWQNAIVPAWNGISSVISTVWNATVSPIFDFFKGAFDTVGAAASWFYENAIRPAFDGVKSAVSGAWDFISPIFDWIGAGIDGIGTIASGVADAMRAAFSGVVDVLKAPVRYIGSLLARIPDKIGPFTVPGAATLNSWGESLQALKSGGSVAGVQNGWLYGPGTGTSDSILGVNSWGVPTALVSAGEFVVNAKAASKWGPLLQLINADGLPALAGGGVVSADELNQFAQGVEGQPYVWGGIQWGDCSGAVSAIARYAVGMDPFGGRFATGNQEESLAAMGFQSGLGPAGSLNIGWFNGGPYGGHTAATLPNGVNFEMGGQRGDGQYGGIAAGASDPMFTDHAHLPPEAFLGGDPDMTGVDIFGQGNGGGSGGLSGFSYPGGDSGGSGGTGGGGTGGSGGSAGSWQGKVVQGDAHPVFVVNWPAGSGISTSQSTSPGPASGVGTTTADTPPPGGTGVDETYNDGETADWHKRITEAGGNFAKANTDQFLGDLGVGGSSGALPTLIQELAKLVGPTIELHVNSVDEALGKARAFLQQEALSFSRR